MRFYNHVRLIKSLLILQILTSSFVVYGDSEKTASPPTPEVKVWDLQDVVKISLEQNPSLKAAEANYRISSKQVLETFGHYLPHLSFDGNYEETTLPNPSAAATSQVGIQMPYSSVVGKVRQLIFDFGKTINDISAQRDEMKSKENEAVAVKNAVELAATKAYFAASAADRLVEVAEEAVKTFQETHRRTEVLVRTGVRPSFDLSQANVQLAQSKLQLVNTQNAQDLAHITLINVMGFRDDIQFKLKPYTPSKQIDPTKLNIHELNNLALTNRPEIKMSEFAVQASAERLNSAIKGYLPSLNLDGWYGQFYPNYPTQLSTAWGAGITLHWDIFDGLETAARTGERNAEVEMTTSRLEKEKEDIVAEVARQYHNLSRAEAELSLANETQIYAKDNAHFASKRWENGVGTFLDLLIGDTSFISAETSKIQAEYGYELAVKSLELAINGPLPVK